MQLNPQQQAAVTAPLENSLVLAGAGTGKTRVLVERIAYLIGNQIIAPNQIMAITFTRKAAKEIIERTQERLFSMNPRFSEMFINSITMGNFHSVFGFILRANLREQQDLRSNFVILEANTSKNLVNKIIKEKDYQELQGNTRLIDLITTAKENLITSKDFTWDNFEVLMRKFLNLGEDAELSSVGMINDTVYHQIKDVYQTYEQTLITNNQVDFSDLLVRTYWMFHHNPALLKRFQQKYRFIVVDECQDMNLVQYKLIHQLYNPEYNHVTMIGDDDQSIYGFRGANVKLIDRFLHEFPDVQVYKLEENYRCSPNIIATANHIINREKTHNIKVLKASKAQTHNRPVIYQKFASQEIAYNRIVELIQRDKKYAGTAILSRNNQGLNSFETYLNQAQIPYTRATGVKFYERAEIQTAMGYLRLVINPSDTEAFNRVINVPKRGLGPAAVAKILDVAQDYQMNLVQAMQYMVDTAKVKGKTLNNYLEFLDALKACNSEKFGRLDHLMETIYENFELVDYFRKQDNGSSREQYLQELVSICGNFVPDFKGLDEGLIQQEKDLLRPLHPGISDSELDKLYGHLNFINTNMLDNQSLDNGIDPNSAVLLSTIHGVKGLEFDRVFLIDFDERTMPSQMSSTPDELDEERRLLYVALTRAREDLMIAYASYKITHGRGDNVDTSIYEEELLDPKLLDSGALKLLETSRNRSSSSYQKRTQANQYVKNMAWNLQRDFDHTAAERKATMPAKKLVLKDGSTVPTTSVNTSISNQTSHSSTAKKLAVSGGTLKTTAGGGALKATSSGGALKAIKPATAPTTPDPMVLERLLQKEAESTNTLPNLQANFTDSKVFGKVNFSTPAPVGVTGNFTATALTNQPVTASVASQDPDALLDGLELMEVLQPMSTGSMLGENPDPLGISDYDEQALLEDPTTLQGNHRFPSKTSTTATSSANDTTLADTSFTLTEEAIKAQEVLEQSKRRSLAVLASLQQQPTRKNSSKARAVKTAKSTNMSILEAEDLFNQPIGAVSKKTTSSSSRNKTTRTTSTSPTSRTSAITATSSDHKGDGGNGYSDVSIATNGAGSLGSLATLERSRIMVLGYHDFLQLPEVIDCLQELNLQIQQPPQYKGVDVVFMLNETADAKQDLARVKMLNRNLKIFDKDDLENLLTTNGLA